VIRIVNCIISEGPRRRFDARVVPAVAEIAGRAVDVAHLAGGLEGPDAEGATHLVVSGSELSASKPNEEDEALVRVIRGFVESGRPVLGLCYGHQMIAKALVGQRAVVRAKRGEFGWRRIDIRPNALFAGIEDLIAAQSHYDEVRGLPDTFEVIASTPSCAVQAFQLRTRPVWGVQFHPEVDHDSGNAMFAENLSADPAVETSFIDDLDDPTRLRANRRLFQNFFRAERVDPAPLPIPGSGPEVGVRPRSGKVRSCAGGDGPDLPE